MAPGAADWAQQMRSAAREGAGSHLPVMGTLCAEHIAPATPSKSGLRSSVDAHGSRARLRLEARKAPITRWADSAPPSIPAEIDYRMRLTASRRRTASTVYDGNATMRRDFAVFGWSCRNVGSP